MFRNEKNCIDHVVKNYNYNKIGFEHNKLYKKILKNKILKSAILITCFNRVETTKECLKYCYKSFMNIEKYQHDIYLLDDNSNDKTGEIVKKSYPDINVIYGDGLFFWSKGTRKAWEYAYEKRL